MKKTLLTLMSCMVALFASAQEPVITLTAEVTDAERTFEFGSAVAEENKISIDWGDGTVVEGATITGMYDGWTTTTVTGTPKGTGEIKIYTTGAICYFGCVSKVDGPGITTLDASKATELTELYANGNKLTSFDGSKLEKLSKLYLNNNLLTEVNLPASLTYLQLANNKLNSFDGGKLTAVTTLYLSDNNLGTLDVSNMPALKSLYAINCGLTSFNAGALTTAKAYISVNNNLLETLDVSEATGLESGSLFAMGNNLTEIKLPNVQVKAVNISKNKFTLATIPATANVKTLTYVPQQDMVIEDINETIDLSAQNNLTGFAAEAQPTVYTWIAETGDTLKADVDYTEEAGVFTFIKEQAQKVYCTMTTEALPKFTGANVFKTVAVAVTPKASKIEFPYAGAYTTGSIKLTHLQGEGSTLDAQVVTISEAEGKFNVTFPSFNTMIGMPTGEIIVEDVTITEKADGSYDLSKEKFTVGQGFVTYPYSSFAGTVYADGSVEMTVKVVQNPELGALTTAVFSAEAAEIHVPVITLTAEVTDAERTFEFGSAVEGENKISIDWGDGTIVEGATITGVYDGWTTTTVTGTPKGTGEIKIYTADAICYFGCVSKVDGPGITTLDASKATELTELYANGNKLTSFDGSKLEKLSKLYLNNNSLTEVSLPASLTYLQLANNKLTSFDGSKLTAVSTLYLSDNNLGTLDVSNMPALKSLYAINCGLTSFNAGAMTVAKSYISVNNNLLETLDVSEATGLENGSLFAMGNNLTEIKLPNVQVKAVNISKNKFTLATIPATANVKTLTYAPQQDMVIEDINETIDLSAQNNLTGFAAEAKATVYTWYAEDGTALVAGTDYTEEAGKFTFIKEQAQKVYCTMTTEALPKFTGTSVFKTTAVAVTAVASGIENVEADAALVGDIYSVDGKLIKRGAAVSEMPKGLYIVKTAAGKAVKVVRK